jgi:hypothetical protein
MDESITERRGGIQPNAMIDAPWSDVSCRIR